MTEAIGLLSGVVKSPFELKRLEREIDKLSSIDRAGAFELKGHLAAASGDVAGCINLFERALTVTDDFIGTAVRYLLVLARLGESKKVIETYRRHADLLRTNPEALRSVSTLLGFSGWILSAHIVNEELVRMGLQPDPTSIIGPSQKIKSRGFKEEDIAEAVGFVHRYLRSCGVFPLGTRHYAAEYEDGSTAIMFHLAIDKDPVELASIEMDLFGALGEKAFPIEEQRFVIFSVASGTNQDANNVQ